MERASTGERDHHVTIQKRATADAVDDAGFPTDNAGGWTTLARVWMRRTPIIRRSDQERMDQLTLSAKGDDSWDMPYIASMDPDTVAVPKLRRLVYQGRVYDITGANRIGRDDIQLFTIAKVDQ